MSLWLRRWPALAALIVGALCLTLAPYAPWLGAWPSAWSLPVTEWIGEGVDAFIAALKPSARAFSRLLAYPMEWANAALTQSPWPLTIGLATALSWRVGGWRLALLPVLGLGFVLASGYWNEGMTTLALVFIAAPLALLAGFIIGILGHQIPLIKRAVETMLDVMQTVPTFAYLTPLLALFSFGPSVGVIASAIYAAPPMARNLMLGLARVDPEMLEAARMGGANRLQRLFWVQLPAAKPQILVGVNQCLMATLSMVIIAAVIGGFDDIGWEVLLNMRKANFGQSLLAGLVIVVFAILLDRISARLAEPGGRGDGRAALVLVGAAGVAGLAAYFAILPAAETLGVLDGVARSVDQALTAFTTANGALLETIKNKAMLYGLLPLRIGLDDAVYPFTWGFRWTPLMSDALYAVAFAAALGLTALGRFGAGVALLVAAGVVETGILNLPWPFVLVGVGALAWRASGPGLTLFVVLALLAILVSGLWDRALLSVYLCGAAVAACALVGGALGTLAALVPLVWRVLLQPLCDMLQTIPLFVFLIPALMFFQIGEFAAFLAICAYAVAPMIRYTRHGLTTTPPELLEAATAHGASGWRILASVRFPYAAPAILLGLNQTILYAFAMLVIAALVGTTGLGQSIYVALGRSDPGLGVSAGAAMALLALIADRIAQGYAEQSKKALGLA